MLRTDTMRENDNISYVDVLDSIGTLLTETKEYSKLPKRLKISLDSCLGNYKHATFVVTSIEDYLKVVFMLQSVAQSILQSTQVIYRGQANYEWDLVPSLWRLTQSDEFTEHRLVSEFINQNPNDFKEIESDFDLLAKMQHYGLPTRLLDFTANPLVALYFACEDKSQSTARILAHIYDDSNNGNVIDAICGSWRFDTIDLLKLDELLKMKNVSLMYFLYYLFGYKGATLFKRPKYWNQRLKNQAAMFMIYPDTVCDKYGDKLRKIKNGFEDLYDNDTKEKFEYLSGHEPCFRELINNDAHFKLEDFYLNFETWSKIKDCYSINDENILFNKESSLSEYGLESWLSDVGKKVLLNRFALEYNENFFSEDIIECKFCSILIPPKYKEKILYELEVIGINIGFIYPELEYSAKNIKARYV